MNKTFTEKEALILSGLFNISRKIDGVLTLDYSNLIGIRGIFYGNKTIKIYMKV